LNLRNQVREGYQEDCEERGVFDSVRVKERGDTYGDTNREKTLGKSQHRTKGRDA
jgi:hypothetical protein